MFNIFTPRKSNRLLDVEKYGTARQAREDNTAHAHCTLDKVTEIHSE
jgi:hypothetical protein